MGRYYHGTINGKWAFGILESTTPAFFHPDGRNKICYHCPAGNEDSDDDTFFDDECIPEDRENSESWTPEQADFMRQHGDCLRENKVCCFNEREDSLIYQFFMDDYDFVVRKQKELEDLMPGSSLAFAKMDFNDLMDVTDDKFETEDGDETYVSFPGSDIFPDTFSALYGLYVKHYLNWPSMGNRITLLIFPFAMRRIHQDGYPLATGPPHDVNIYGTPAQPICCQCQIAVPDVRFDKKKKLLSEWDFEKVSSYVNPFVFDGDTWFPGKRFTTWAPFFCLNCLQHRFWDPLLPPTSLPYTHFMENIRGDFVHTAMRWSFGEQLRQALSHVDVWIESEI